MNDYQRGVIAAQLAEPFDEEESINWMEGYFHEIYHPSGGLVPQDDTFEPGRPYWDEMEANP